MKRLLNQRPINPLLTGISENSDMDNLAVQQAIVLYDRAFRQQLKGNFGEAITLYKRSIELHPTAEAHTFLGWTYSMLDRYDEAIEECKTAIDIDPEYGNPYNDIGSYLITLGRPQEAIVCRVRL